MKKSNTGVVLGAALICLGVFGFGCGAEESALTYEVGKADFSDKISLSKQEGQEEIVRIVECNTRPSCDIVVKVDKLNVEVEMDVHPANKAGIYFRLANIDGEAHKFPEDLVRSLSEYGYDQMPTDDLLFLSRKMEEPLEVLIEGLNPGRYLATFALSQFAAKASFTATARASCVKSWEMGPETNNTLSSATQMGAIELERTTIEKNQLSRLQTGSIHTWNDVDFYTVDLKEHRTGTIEVKLEEQPADIDLLFKAWALCNSGGDDFTCDNNDDRFFSHENVVPLGPQNCTMAHGSNMMTMDLDCEGDEGAVIFLAVELAKQKDALFPSLGSECHDEDRDNTYTFKVSRLLK